jgi:trans-aconitate methyltransferase
MDASHGFDGAKYAQASTHQKQWGTALVDDLDLSGTEYILDLGCGDGAVTAQLADRVPQGRVVGIDASASMLQAATKHSRSNLFFERTDIAALDHESAFDVVFSNATLHWVLDHDRLLRAIHRALRPGGIARLNFAGDGNCQYFFQAVRETIAREQYARLFQGFQWPYFMPRVEAYREQAGTAPFGRCEIWGENADRYFPDEAALVRWIDQPAIVPFLAFVAGHEQRAAFRGEVVERTLALTKQDDGRCFETFRRINLLAEK